MKRLTLMMLLLVGSLFSGARPAHAQIAGCVRQQIQWTCAGYPQCTIQIADYCGPGKVFCMPNEGAWETTFCQGMSLYGGDCSLAFTYTIDQYSGCCITSCDDCHGTTSCQLPPP
jgi:hypothetical protein